MIKGEVLTHDVSGSYLHAQSRMVTAVGVDSMVVVETRDAVLVAPRNRVQDVKQIVNQLKSLAAGKPPPMPRYTGPGATMRPLTSPTGTR